VTLRGVGAARRVALAITLATGLHAGEPAAAASEPDRDLRMTVAPQLETLEARVTLRLSDVGPDAPSLLLAPSLKIVGALIDGNEVRFEVHQSEGRQQVTFLHERKLTGPHRYTLRYAGHLGAPATIRRDVVSLDPRSYWYPRLPGAKRPLTWRLELELPAGWEAAAGGASVSHRTEGEKSVAVFASPTPAHELHVVAVPATRIERKRVLRPHASDAEASVAEIAVLLSGRDREHAEPCIESAGRYLERYVARFGDYPFERFSIAATPLGSVDGVPGVALLERAALSRSGARDAAIGHQAAHAWWGGAVAVDARSGDWSEALATYLAEYGDRALVGADAASGLRAELLRSYTAVGGTRAHDVPLADRAKGVMLFHMLEQRIGTRRFDEALGRLARSARQRPIDWNVLRASFSASAGEDLTWFFQQWVHRAGAPVLGLADVVETRTSADAESWEVTGTLLQQGEPWRLRVPLVIGSARRNDRRTVDIDGAQARFRFTVPFRPETLAVDPAYDVLRRLGSQEQPPLVAHALSDPRTLLVIEDRAGDSEVAAYRELARTLGGDLPLETVDASQVGAARLAGRSVVLLGLPLGEPTEPLVGALPAEVEILYEGFGIGAGRFRDPRSALLVAARHPDDPARILALFWGLSARAIRQAGPKVPENAEFSWVAFVDGTPGLAGVATVGAGPLQHRFSGNPAEGSGVEQE
jgi:hypothetical protein